MALPTNGDNIAQDHEIGPSSSRTFGLRADRNPAPDIERTYNWEYSAAIQHELTARVSVNFGYYRNEIITVYNLNAAKRSVYGSQIVDKNSDDQSIYDGIELSFFSRLPAGGTLFGG